MTRRILLLVIGLLIAAPDLSRAQNPPAPDPADQESFRKKAIGVFSKPLHPIVKSVAPGGGFGPGIGYKTRGKLQERLFARAEAVITWRKYWNTQANTWFQANYYRIEGYVRAREMTRLDFFGLGEGTSEDGRTNFRFLDRSAGAIGSVRFPQLDDNSRNDGIVAVGGKLEGMWPEIGQGKNDDVPSIEQRFTPLDAPGLIAQPGFTGYTGFVNLNYPGGNQLARHGFDFQVAHTAFRDDEGGQFNFGRTNIESQQRIPGLRPSQKLTLHQLYSTTSVDAGRQVPFYMQYTLGGNGAVRAFNEEFLGSDSTKATLRGFRDLRFRGPHLLLLQAEYRIKLGNSPIDATIFADAGKVTLSRSDLDLGNLKTDYGFSLSLMTDDATAVRVDFGFGSGEGARVFFSVGPIFQQQ